MAKFVLKSTREVTWPVIIRVPVDGGTFEDHQITARFRLFTDDEQKEIFDKHPMDTDKALIKASVTNIEGVQDEAGEDRTFSKELLDEMLGWNFVLIAFVRAYNEARLGARAKN